MYTFRIEVYTPGLIMSGSYDLPLYRRVSDALNSGMYRYITLRDATIAPFSQPQHAKQVPQMLVDWAGAILVTTLVEPEPPIELRAAETAPRDAQSMMFFTSAFAVRGNFYKRPDLDLSEMLARLTEDFISLSEVQVHPLSGGQPVTRQFACLNRQYIHALYAVGASTVPIVTPAAEPIPTPSSPHVAAPTEPAPRTAEAAPVEAETPSPNPPSPNDESAS